MRNKRGVRTVQYANLARSVSFKKIGSNYYVELSLVKGYFGNILVSLDYPQMEIYKFTNLETEPSYTDFMQWTNVKNLKNIYWKNYEGKWVVI